MKNLLYILLMVAIAALTSCSSNHYPVNKHVKRVQAKKKPACYKVTGYTRIF